jgi:P27 family predicted phage terminase small subunit
MRVLTDVDRTALVSYAVLYQRWVVAEEQVRRLGVLIKSPNGFPVHNPYLSVATKAMTQMIQLLREFGMTPSSRTSISAMAEEERGLAEILFAGIVDNE